MRVRAFLEFLVIWYIHIYTSSSSSLLIQVTSICVQIFVLHIDFDCLIKSKLINFRNSCVYSKKKKKTVDSNKWYCCCCLVHINRALKHQSCIECCAYFCFAFSLCLLFCLHLIPKSHLLFKWFFFFQNFWLIENYSVSNSFIHSFIILFTYTYLQ